MSDIKSVIALLCKHLKLSFNVNIRPEHFRLAKFDKLEDNAVGQMWEILYKICSEEYPQIVEDDVVNFVKLCLAMMGYKSIELYCLPSDMSYGSRELLLALAWILAAKNILENSVERNLKCSPLNLEFDNSGEAAVDSSVLQIHKSGSLESCLNSILWFAGKIRQNINAVAELSQARISLANKVHEGSINASGLPHLSVSETMLIRDPKLLPEYLSRVGDKCALIEIHKHWGKKCHIFWEWMETVIAEKECKGDLTHLSVEQKRIMFNTMDTLRNRIKSIVAKHERLTCEESSDIVPHSIHGMPRCLLQPKEKDTEMTHLIAGSGKDLEQLQETLIQKETEIKLQLHEIAKKMDYAVVLFPQE